ncbi:MAG: FG-GAP-like repeat-containing protein [bacterium]
MRDLLTGDAAGYLTLFLETGSGLHNNGHIKRDSSGILVDIKVNEHSFPFINDWNEDEKKDLIIGEFEGQPFDSGSVRVYPNNNTNAEPEFKSYTMIRSGGLPIAHSNSVPNVCDLDGDNVKDLILGNTNGYVYYYRNIGSNAAPLFETEYETLKTINDVFIDSYSNSRIYFVDWTGDGDLDMLLGGAEGYVWICENSTVPNGKEIHNTFSTEQIFRIVANPVRNKVHLEYSLENPAYVTIHVYTIAGEIIATPLQQQQQVGNHNIVWDGLDYNGKKAGCGIYFIKMKSGYCTVTKKLILLK